VRLTWLNNNRYRSFDKAQTGKNTGFFRVLVRHTTEVMTGKDFRGSGFFPEFRDWLAFGRSG
jgi:hypothetical protein